MFVALSGERYPLWRAVDEHAVELDILLQKRRDKAAAKRVFKTCTAFEPGTGQDRHRSVAQLSGGKSRDTEPCECEASVCQIGSSAEQPREEILQPARERAPHARFTRPETHTEISVVLRTDQAQFAARFVEWRKLAEIAQNPYTAF